MLLRILGMLVRQSLSKLLSLLLVRVRKSLLMLLLMLLLHLRLLILMVLLNLLLVLTELLVLTDCLLRSWLSMRLLRTSVGGGIIRVGLLHWLLLRVLSMLRVLLLSLHHLHSLLLRLLLLLLSLQLHSLLVLNLLQGRHVGHRSLGLARSPRGGHSMRGSPRLRLQSWHPRGRPGSWHASRQCRSASCTRHTPPSMMSHRRGRSPRAATAAHRGSCGGGAPSASEG